MKETKVKKDILWINIAKAMGIIAVIIDHTKGTLYNNQNIANFSYYSVSLFVLISGYLTFASYERHKYKFEKAITHFTKKMIIVYLIATIIYQIYKTNRFDLELFLNNIIHFNASPPLYYVSIYIQLMLVSYLMYHIVKSFNHKYEILLIFAVLVILILLAHWSVHNTNLFKIYGGGGKLLGGTYIILFFIGMLMCRYNVFREYNINTLVAMFIISCLCFFIVYHIQCVDKLGLDKSGVFGRGYNPPGITFMSLALSMMFICFSISQIVSKIPIVNKTLLPLNFIGKHTLYIFVYHSLVKSFLDKILFGNIIIKCIVYFLCMIYIPTLFELLVGLIKNKLSLICNDN